jgi:hypothetical protein
MRRLLRKLAAWIDSESVRHYQNVIYAAYLCAGVHALGDAVDNAWTVMLIACPLISYAGIWARRHNLAGLWLQLAGDIGFAVATWAYVAAIVQATYAKQATFSAWLGAAIGLCAFGVIIRDVRILRSVTVRIRQLDREDDA